MRTIAVTTGRPYSVHIGRGLLRRSGEIAAEQFKPCAVALVTDANVAVHYAQAVRESFEAAGFRVSLYVIPPGEASKSAARLTELLEFLAEQGISRSDKIVALGGGVVGDLAGFAAAVYLRGIGYIGLPTTLLAAVDSSVGGKTAVNLTAGKNLMGAFWQPELVLCDCDAFNTLPRADLAAGAAECLKYAVLGDRAMLARLINDGLETAWEEIVAPCVEQKAEIVAQDERDDGLRQLLNLGHTVGHAIERLNDYSIRHGEGVGLGMLIIARAAERMGLCVPGVSGAIEAALRALALPTECGFSPDDLARAALSDKKRRGGQITLVVPRDIGDCALHPVDVSELPRIIALGMEAIS